MIAKTVRPLTALCGLLLIAVVAAAQNRSSHGSDALHYYYSDLNQALLQYSLDDVPFEQQQIKAGNGETLIEVARRSRFRELDFYHLAAALYEINGNISQLQTGDVLSMPTVGDLINAQPRYENLKVIGDEIDFEHSDNQMRHGLRWPFGKSLVLIGPNARDELPANQEVTLTSYRPGAIAGTSPTAKSSFLSNAANLTADQVVVVAQADDEQTYGKWLDQTDYSPIATSDPLNAFESAATDSAATASDEEAEYIVQLTDDLLVAEPTLVEPSVDEAPVVADARDSTLYSSNSIYESEAVEVANMDLAIAEALDTKALDTKALVAEAVLEEPSVRSAEPVLSQSEPQASQTVAANVPAPDAAQQVAASVPLGTPAAEPVAEVAAGDTKPLLGENTGEDSDADAQDVTPAEAETTVASSAAAAPVSRTEIVRDANLATLDAASGFYLGKPRNAIAGNATDLPADPLSYPIEWSFDNTASVGTVLNKLAEYIGYELTSEHNLVLNAYTRRLPRLQLQINGVTVEEGFQILAGRGLETIFNHVERSVKHIPRVKTEPQVSAAIATKNHEAFIEKSGVSAFLKEFPADIKNAALRHAARCNSTASTSVPDINSLHERVVGNLQQAVTDAEIQRLVQWYNSPTGEKILALERAELDDAKLQKFTVDPERFGVVEQIYNGTVTGRGVASIAIELDHAGWSLSGCRQQANSTADKDKLNEELAYGEGIKSKIGKLESILRNDMVRSMAYLFDALSIQELTEYASVTQQNNRLYTSLQQAIVDAIETESEEIPIASLHE